MEYSGFNQHKKINKQIDKNLTNKNKKIAYLDLDYPKNFEEIKKLILEKNNNKSYPDVNNFPE